MPALVLGARPAVVDAVVWPSDTTTCWTVCRAAQAAARLVGCKVACWGQQRWRRPHPPQAHAHPTSHKHQRRHSVGRAKCADRVAVRGQLQGALARCTETAPHLVASSRCGDRGHAVARGQGGREHLGIIFGLGLGGADAACADCHSGGPGVQGAACRTPGGLECGGRWGGGLHVMGFVGCVADHQPAQALRVRGAASRPAQHLLAACRRVMLERRRGGGGPRRHRCGGWASSRALTACICSAARMGLDHPQAAPRGVRPTQTGAR